MQNTVLLTGRSGTIKPIPCRHEIRVNGVASSILPSESQLSVNVAG